MVKRERERKGRLLAHPLLPGRKTEGEKESDRSASPERGGEKPPPGTGMSSLAFAAPWPRYRCDEFGQVGGSCQYVYRGSQVARCRCDDFGR